MLSPWLFFYARQLWDNSLGIPISALMLAAYADFLSSRWAWSVRLAVFCAMLLVLTHFMAIPIVVAIGVHLAVVEFRSLWRFKWSIAVIIVVILGISRPYWNYLYHNYHHSIPGGTSPSLGWFFPLLGAHHLSAAGLQDIFGATWPDPMPRILSIAVAITTLEYLASWVGMLLTIPSVWRVARQSERASTDDQVYSVVWIAVIFQCLLYGPLHVYEGAHYFNAAWICFAAFAFRTVKAAPKWCAPILAVYAAAQILIVATIAVTISRDCGMRSPNYGTALSNQIAAVRQMERYSADSPRQIDVPEWSEHPRTPAVLEILLPPPPGARPRGNLVIRFRDAFPGDAGIVVTNH
jgi:hypothetical protein